MMSNNETAQCGRCGHEAHEGGCVHFEYDAIREVYSEPCDCKGFSPAAPDEKGREEAWNNAVLIRSDSPIRPSAGERFAFDAGYDFGYAARTADAIAAFVDDVMADIDSDDGDDRVSVAYLRQAMRAVMERRTAAKDDGREGCK
jgi:hypothetical protein